MNHPVDTAGACPCGSGTNYVACCGRFHHGPLHLAAPDASLLMRSRYSAFAMQLKQYLLDTWHPSTRPASLGEEPEGTRWLGLQIKQFASIDADHATVEFVARSKHGGRAHRLHETSRFVRVDGRWFYVDGDVA